MTADLPTLQVITCSTRPGRTGPLVAAWAAEQARAHGAFAVESVDLADYELPILDEASHPRLTTYEHETTKRWSETVRRGDAYVFVLPEYAFAMPASLLNALQVLYHEWSYKPAAFVSYGGESGGLRSAQMTRQVLTTFKVVPMVEAVSIHHIRRQLDAGGDRFTPDAGCAAQAAAMLTELRRWSDALRVLRPA